MVAQPRGKTFLIAISSPDGSFFAYSFNDYAGRRLDRGVALATGYHLQAFLG
ncbi:hypothetical protein [Bradyrhizobium vignae]|uniref:hypothetical protein n=1 Tax=Bradyrhizobium vignae TaxID=1549949 RepID=UPI0013E8B824|nr:hypothetical protein [Bradyrhizobium vignae]